jgi:ribonuclease T1
MPNVQLQRCVLKILAMCAIKTAKIPRKALPNEAITTLDSIKNGPPYPYPKDGTVFRNYEGCLPVREDGYYKEFTVETLGEIGRGARRIVQGRNGELYYTDDHYQTFMEIIE